MAWETFWAIFSQTRRFTLVPPKGNVCYQGKNPDTHAERGKWQKNGIIGD
jgi:hypothetical protein